MDGAGRVVTGAVLAGRVQVGDTVRLLPQGQALRVRGLQVQGVAVPSAQAGQRCAVNLAGAELKRIREARKDIGVWLASDERPEALKDDAAKLTMIAIDFPKFADGRGYSIAYNLRARYDYTGELRAVGDVLRDQLFYMQRVGFNSFAVRADRDVNDALKGLSDFSESYQQSWDKKTPLFRRVDRQAVAPK